MDPKVLIYREATKPYCDKCPESLGGAFIFIFYFYFCLAGISSANILHVLPFTRAQVQSGVLQEELGEPANSSGKVCDPTRLAESLPQPVASLWGRGRGDGGLELSAAMSPSWGETPREGSQLTENSADGPSVAGSGYAGFALTAQLRVL